MSIDSVTPVNYQHAIEHLEFPACPRNKSVPTAIRPSGRNDEIVLIEIGSANDCIFEKIHRTRNTADDCYKLFVQAKQVCLDDFRSRGYIYSMSLVDNHDPHSVIFFSRDERGRVNGVLRVCFDSEHLLPLVGSIPEEFSQLRRQNLKLAEPGRFSLKPDCKLLNRYLSAIYQLAVLSEVDRYLLQVRAEHAPFYARTFGATALPSVDAPEGCVNQLWDISRTPERFFQVFGEDQTDLKRLLINSGER